MENYYAQVAVASSSGETADVAVNTFAIQCTDTLSQGQADDWQVALKQFYLDCLAAGALAGRASTGHTTKMLKATMTVPNYPLYTYAWNLSGQSIPSIDLPNEVALCVSYAADQYPLVPRARRRGRIYISGWVEGMNAAGRPYITAYEDLATAYADYATTVVGITGINPGVWSRSSGDVYLIDRVWCDNEWDTMRSRGGKSTIRKTITV
uniref:Uncharacterized protein n=1 Tax=uncultured prokaryote TaxID=198431 RepID=A0A0H5Q465_9ZZZZ|nr:hypothetical protein [uncultured prokaryote]